MEGNDTDTVICVSDDEDNEEDDEDWNEKEIIKRVIELSKLEASKQNEDRKRALEFSLRSEPVINYAEHQSKAESQEVLELSDDNDERDDKTEVQVVSPSLPGIPGTSSNSKHSRSVAPATDTEETANYNYIGDVFTDLANIENSMEESSDIEDFEEPPNEEYEDTEIVGDSDSDIEEITLDSRPEEVTTTTEVSAEGNEDLDSVIITHINPTVAQREIPKPSLSSIESKFGGSISVTQVQNSEDPTSGLVDISEQDQNSSYQVPEPEDEVRVASDFDDDVVADDYYQEADSLMTTEEVSRRMRNVFESSLRLHLAGEEMEACNAVSTPLFPHQRLALAWMVGHERTENDGMLGGILADDMGLGKTLTVLALILTNHWDDRPLAVQQAGYSRPNFTCQRKSYKSYKRKVCDGSEEPKKRKRNDFVKDPSSSSSDDEFDQMSKDNSLSEKLHQTSSIAFQKRKNPLKDIVFDCTDSESETEVPQIHVDDEDDDDDVASMIPQDLTSSINLDGLMEGSESETEDIAVAGVSGERRRHTNPSSVIFYSDSEASEDPSSPQKGQDEDSLVNVETGLKLIIPPKVAAVRRGRRRATLVVCPTSLISQWVDQLQLHTHRNVNVQLKIHHGGGKAVTGTELECHDLVITTYGTLAAEWDLGDLSPLMRAKWLRVVLDEGHMIKNHNAKCAKAAMDLDTLRKWVVTGTPIQNNLMELWSLVNWLDFGVYAGRQRLSLFKEQIELPCKRGSLVGFERLQVLVDAVCLRRTKSDRTPSGAPLVCLPPKEVLTRRVELGREERSCYQVYHNKARQLITRFRRRGELLRNYAHVFALMTRLRQLCCHRSLVKDVDWEAVLRDEDVSLRGEESQQERVARLREMIADGVTEDCALCLSDLSLPVITQCGHVFCKVCIETYLQTYRPSHCPLCLNSLNKRQLVQPTPERHRASKAFLSDMEDIIVEVSSSKVNAVLRELLRIRRDCPEDKMVVVSQFTSFLSILQPLLREKLSGVSFTRLDGGMSPLKRAESLKTFQSSKRNSPKILLLSLKAGGVGLNLTAANHLLLLDPAWNPASEWQCFDRIHRLGQTKQVFIYKFITKQSVEEKMLDIQDKKEGLISGAFHVQEKEKRRRRVDDIINIFSL